MAHDVAINDIGNALLDLRRAFLKHNIPPPDVIRYSDLEQAHRAMSHLRSIEANSLVRGARVDLGGKPVLEIAGFFIE